MATTKANPFQKATSVQKKIKLLLYGDWGTGKTVVGLSFPRVALIDTEGSADLYGPGRQVHWGTVPEYDVLRTKSFEEILDALDAIKADAGRNWQTLIIDPATVVWQVLQDAGQLAAETRASQRGNYDASNVALTQRDWGTIKRKLYRAMIDMVNLPVNVILTAHLKDVTEQRGSGQNMTAVKVGEKPDAEKKTPYWFDVVVKMETRKDAQGETTHGGVIEKDRSGLFRVGQWVPNLQYSHFAPILEAYSQGETVVQQGEDEAAERDAALLQDEAPRPKRTDIAAIRKLAADKGISNAALTETIGRDYGVETLDELTEANAALLKARLEKAQKKAA